MSALGPDTPDEFADVRHKLLPAIKHRTYCGSPSLSNADVAFCPISDHVSCGFAYDRARIMHILTVEQFSQWRIPLAEAMDIAARNLAKRTSRRLMRWSKGVWIAAWGDSYDSSRLLLHDYIRSHDVRGLPVVAVPTRDNLILTGSEDEEGLKGMAELLKRALPKGRLISSRPMVLEANEWRPLVLPKDHPAEKSLAHLREAEVASLYGQQERDLAAREILATSYTVTAEQDHLLSYTAWTEGIEQLLPRVDRIALFRVPLGQDRPEPLGFTTWDRVQEVASGTLRPVPDMYPARWEVVRFPNADELAALQLQPFTKWNV